MPEGPIRRSTMTVEEAAEVLGVSRSTAYESARRFESTDGAEGLPVLRIGRRFVVPVGRIQELLGESCG